MYHRQINSYLTAWLSIGLKLCYSNMTTSWPFSNFQIWNINKCIFLFETHGLLHYLQRWNLAVVAAWSYGMLLEQFVYGPPLLLAYLISWLVLFDFRTRLLFHHATPIWHYLSIGCILIFLFHLVPLNKNLYCLSHNVEHHCFSKEKKFWVSLVT